ncbi:MAG: hypothetical protein JWP97_1853 [Labilithrix sp.]|nr:hypothetical protein [Labilithrix sp.]
MVVYANGEASSLRLEGTRAWGPAAELKRFDGAYRGTLQGHVVDLRFVDDRVTGVVGLSRVDIHVSEVNGRVHGQGLLNGHVSRFDVDDETLEGTFGMCSYQMKRRRADGDEAPPGAAPGDEAPAGKDDYYGYRSCNGSPTPVAHVRIPEVIRSLPALDQATLYALMLAG